MDTVLSYNGTVPVGHETIMGWVREGVTRVRIEFVAPLGDIIDAHGMDDWNNYVDETVGISLVDLDYGFAKPSADDDLGTDNALLYVEGDIDIALAGE